MPRSSFTPRRSTTMGNKTKTKTKSTESRSNSNWTTIRKDDSLDVSVPDSSRARGTISIPPRCNIGEESIQRVRGR